MALRAYCRACLGKGASAAFDRFARLVLKEEIHLRRVQRTERHRETVTLRQQRAVIERAGPEADGDRSPHAATGTPKEENPH